MSSEPKNPLKMISDPFAGDSFVLPKTLCTDERRLWFCRNNEIIAFLMTTEHALTDCKDKYCQLLEQGRLKPETMLKIESSDGRSLMYPVQSLVKQCMDGVDVLCRQAFVMLYGSLETFLFQLLERSYIEIGTTQSILDYSLDIMMRRQWDAKFCKMSDVFDLGFEARALIDHFKGFSLDFEGTTHKNALIFLDEVAQVRHRIVHASSIWETGQLISINGKLLHSFYAFNAHLT